MRGKNAISAIVATVLTIMITVAAIVIVWTAVLPMVNKNFDAGVGDVRLSVSSREGYTVYDIGAGRFLSRFVGGAMMLRLKRWKL